MTPPAMTSQLIRRATVADTAALAHIGRATFTETFSHLYPPQDLADFLTDSHNLERTHQELSDPLQAAWLVEQEGLVVGYAQAGPCKLPHLEVSPADGELKRIYLLSAHRGHGAGSRLLAATLSWLEKDGPRTLWIGVWSGNFGAQRLYERHGFQHVGEYEFPVGRVRDREFILRRPALPETKGRC